MSEVISPEDIKKTQSALTKYINQPPLTEKLLRKPPFRFLYDIIKSVSFLLFLKTIALIKLF